MAKIEKKLEDVFQTLYPGTEVVLEKFTVTVYPLAFSHLKKFSSQFGGVLRVIANTTIPKNVSKNEATKAMMIQAIPYVLENCAELFEECVVFDESLRGGDSTLDLVPHWEIPKIIEAWIIESFGDEGKWRPWIDTIENIIKKVTGEELQILETLSNLWSQQGTDSKISLKDNNEDSPIGDGPILNSNSGVKDLQDTSVP